MLLLLPPVSMVSDAVRFFELPAPLLVDIDWLENCFSWLQMIQTDDAFDATVAQPFLDPECYGLCALELGCSFAGHCLVRQSGSLFFSTPKSGVTALPLKDGLAVYQQHRQTKIKIFENHDGHGASLE